MNWSASTEYLSNKINSLSIDETLLTPQCTYITKNFDELLKKINDIENSDSQFFNMNSDLLRDFKKLYAEINKKRNEGYKWKNAEYNFASACRRDISSRSFLTILKYEWYEFK